MHYFFEVRFPRWKHRHLGSLKREFVVTTEGK
jgi:hypothetical protein